VANGGGNSGSGVARYATGRVADDGAEATDGRALLMRGDPARGLDARSEADED
jgi:hypothetical protein